MKLLTILLTLLIAGCCKVEAQSKWHKGETRVYADSGRLVATLDTNNKWHIIDTMATIKTLCVELNRMSEIARYKADLYYALFDVVNASYPKHPSKKAKMYLKKYFELRNKPFNQ